MSVSIPSPKSVLFFITALAWILISCHSVEPTPTERQTPTLFIFATRTVTPSSTPTVIPTEIPAKVSELEVTPEPEPSPARENFRVCSPLAWETVVSLIEIVSDPYRPPPLNRPEERHHGVDFSHYRRKDLETIEGEPVQSILDGSVVSVIQNRLPYGNMVIVETQLNLIPDELIKKIGGESGQSLYVLYAHLNPEPLVSLNEQVVCGQQLGLVGKSGYNVVNPHLHMETRLGASGGIFPGMAFYTTDATIEEMQTYTLWRTSGAYVHFDPMLLFQSYLEWKPEQE